MTDWTLFGLQVQFIEKRVENATQSEHINFGYMVILGAVHNCQHLNECTKHTFSDPPPPQKVYPSTFFKWIICHENDKKG